MRWTRFRYLVLAPGVALLLHYFWSNAAWSVKLRVLVIQIKLLLPGAAIWLPAWRAELFRLFILISGLVAHAPGRVRSYGLLPGNREN